jgi:hypothetical protein
MSRAERQAALAMTLALGVLPAAGAVACSTAETVAFTDGGPVAAGSLACSSDSATIDAGVVACAPDGGSKVSFEKDIFEGILEKEPGCTAKECHGDATPPKMVDASTAYQQLKSHVLAGTNQRYIVPGDAGASKILCNLADCNGCGVSMPIRGGTKLTQDDLNTIARWIACGAPEN